MSADRWPSDVALDCQGLSIVAVSSDSGPLAFRDEPASERLAIGPIPLGTRQIHIEYRGQVAEGPMIGLYVSPLGDGRLITTDLEPTGARQVLPCLDRPDVKAVFSVEVTHPAPLTAISNSPPAESGPAEDGRTRVRFAPTPPMSTYLLYVGVGPFEERTEESRSPRVIVAAAKGRANEGAFALAQARPILDYFADYYGIPFPLPKLHLVAVPHYGSGAMENWGAITFQEYYLLLTPRSPAATRQELAVVLAHEIAHQWFGNLVTMRWWSDLWLNESFATFASFRAIDALFPEWRVWEGFLRTQTAGAMRWDALPGTHPVHLEVSEPDQVQQIFDEISYGKGASVLRMVNGYVGEERFRDGVSRYLRTHREGNADASDLGTALARSAEEPVDRVISAWVERDGFPLVEVSQSAGRLRFRQRRFSAPDGRAESPWPIPLTYRAGAATHRRLFDGASLDLPAPTAGPLVVNPGRTGFYRVRYDGELHDRLLRSFDALDPVDRWGLLNDALALTLAGASPLDDYLSLVTRLSAEDDPFVVHELVATFSAHFPLLRRIPRWLEAMRATSAAQLDRLGLTHQPRDAERTKMLREGLLDARVCLDPAFARSLAHRFGEVDRLPAELVGPVLSATAMQAGPEEYAALKDRLRRAVGVEAARQVATALGLLPRDAWVEDGLETVFRGEVTAGAWTRLLGTAIYLNPGCAETVWRFLTRRLPDVARLTAGTGTTGRLVRLAIPALGLDRPAEVRAWFGSHRVAESERGVASGLHLLDVYEAVLARDAVSSAVARADRPSSP